MVRNILSHIKHTLDGWKVLEFESWNFHACKVPETDWNRWNFWNSH